MNMDTKCKTCGQTFGKHYGRECPDMQGVFVPIAKHENFCIGNALKYLWRAGRKDPNKTIKDLKKAAQYIQYEIDRITEEQSK